MYTHAPCVRTLEILKGGALTQNGRPYIIRIRSQLGIRVTPPLEWKE